MITQDLLKELLHYNSNTGIFTRKTSCHIRDVGDRAGFIQSRGYVQISIRGRNYLAHRLAWLYVYGCFPENQIDHINHIKTDNRIPNLRAVTKIENHRNMPISSNNKSGVVGVSWVKDRNKWQSNIRINRIQISLGSYTYKFDAICSRKSAEAKHGFHENHGRQ